jgi:hypothetical protein
MSNFRRLAAQLIDFPETQTINYKAMKKLSIDDSTFSDKVVYHNYSKKTKEGILVLKNNILKINSSAFINNRFLLSIDIPTSVTEISSRAFEGCVNLHTVNIKNTISTINDNTFKNCISLKSINIDNVLNSVGSNVFENCKSLTNIVFSEGVTSIGKSCFKGCAKLNSVTLPKNIKELPEYCFYDCESLEFIDIPEGVTTLNKYAFNKVDGISANIPLTLNKIIIDDTSFYGYKEIESWYFNDLYIKDIDVYFNIDWYNKYSTIAVGKCKNLYVNNELLTTYTFPDTLSEIKRGLFIGCQCIEEITFPNNTFIIKTGAFSNCKNLSILNNFDKCNTAYEGAFSYCDLNTIDLSNFTEIPNAFIAGNKNITTLTIPDTITTIPGYAFYKCSNLQSITLSNSITTISYCAFRECINLQEIYIPETVTLIGESAFSGCKNLNNINIENVIELKSNVFENCTNIQTINLNDSITTLGIKIFYGCKNLRTINTENIITIAQEAFDYCESLETLNISKDCNIRYDIISTKKIAPFIGCNNLNIVLDEENPNYSIIDGFFCTKDGSQILCCAKPMEECIIPNTITSIMVGAFQNRNFSSIKFGDGVEAIPYSLCKNCENLTNIDFNNINTIYNSAFEGCISLEEITFTKNVVFDTLSNINDKNTFKDCVNLKYVNFSNEQTTLYLDIFDNCSSFTDLYISEYVTSIRGSIKDSNIKNIHIKNLDSWLDIDKPNYQSAIKEYGFYNPLVYAENLYINGELVTDVVINRNADEPFLGYKKLNSITITNNYYVTGLAFPNNPNIIIENPSKGVGMFFDENNLLWYGYSVSWGSTNGGLSSGNTFVGDTLDFKGGPGYAYRYVNSYSFLNNNTIEYVYLERAKIEPYTFYGSTKIKAFFIEEDASIHGYGSINHLRLDANCFGEIKSDYKIVIRDDLYDFWYNILKSVNIPNIEDRVITQTEWDYFQELKANQPEYDIPLYVRALAPTSVKFSTNPIEYSLDRHTWNTLAVGASTPTIDVGEKIYFRAKGLTATSANGIGTFSINGKCELGGNAMSMIWGDEFESHDTMAVNYNLKRLFYAQSGYPNTSIVSAEKMVIGCKEVKLQGCFAMFVRCNALIKGCALPATTIGERAYTSMYQECANLEIGSDLPAEDLTTTTYCYNGMYAYCPKMRYLKAMIVKPAPNNADVYGAQTGNWLLDVASTGTFVKNSAATWERDGVDGIPYGWKVELAKK